MATSRESDLSRQFISIQKALYGADLEIEKVINPMKVGEPDIFSIFKGMPLYAESKTINPISLINVYPFKEIQLENLAIKARAGAYCIGLLLMHNVYKYLTYDKLKAHITAEEYKNAPIFNYEQIYKEWRLNVLRS